MAGRIDPRYLTLHKVLDDRLIRIPQYQRAYSWGVRQRRDLFGDILALAAKGKNEQHFMATLVGLQREQRTIRAKEYQVVEIVDGQQRLTTLVILLKALARAMSTEDPEEALVRADLERLLMKGDDVSLVLLQTNHDASNFFADYLRHGTLADPKEAKTSSDRRLLQTMLDCEQFVAEWRKAGRTPVTLLQLLYNRLAFIVHEIDSEATVYTVFEVLNSRGLSVSWFDRLKSILMGIAFETGEDARSEVIDELHRLWRQIYARIGTRDGVDGEVLRFGATLRLTTKPSRPLGDEDAVDTLRDAAQGKAAGAVEVSRWLLRVADSVVRLREDRRLNAVTGKQQARLLAVAIGLRDDLGPADRTTAMAAWEKVAFRIYGLGRRDARWKVGDFVSTAWSVVNQGLDAAKLLGAVRWVGSDHPIASMVTNLRDSNCYDEWWDELRYFLFRYEEHLARLSGQVFSNEQWNRIWEAAAIDSVEHIEPQSKGALVPTTTGIFVHRLGNLMLLPPRLNSQLQAKPPLQKAPKYTETGLIHAREVVAAATQWDRDAVIAREEALIAWATTEWAD